MIKRMRSMGRFCPDASILMRRSDASGDVHPDVQGGMLW